MRRSIKDCAHIIRWALKNNAPVPSSDYEVEEWALALDEKVNEFDRKDPGALTALCPGKLPHSVTLADLRAGFRSRLIETPGVVSAVGDGEKVDADIIIRPVFYDVSKTTEEYFEILREKAQTPDGQPFSEATAMWRHAREMALGLYYRWQPYPPTDWLEARREWCAFSRATLSNNRRLDSELQVIQAVDGGLIKDKDGVLKTWRSERDRPRKEYGDKPYEYVTEPVWFDNAAIETCAKWMRKPGIVWVEHGFFGDALSKHTGAPYFRNKGLTADKKFIDDPALKDWLSKRSVIVSIDANKEGRNLQDKWSRMLYATPQEGADVMQQSIARLHRPGQESDVVEVDLLCGCLEHVRALVQALEMAQVIRDTAGQASKLLLADIEWPELDEVESWSGSRWGNT